MRAREPAIDLNFSELGMIWTVYDTGSGPVAPYGEWSEPSASELCSAVQIIGSMMFVCREWASPWRQNIMINTPTQLARWGWFCSPTS